MQRQQQLAEWLSSLYPNERFTLMMLLASTENIRQEQERQTRLARRTNTKELD